MWQLQLDTETLTFFEFFLVPEDLLRCRVVLVAKLESCRVPSSSNKTFGRIPEKGRKVYPAGGTSGQIYLMTQEAAPALQSCL